MANITRGPSSLSTWDPLREMRDLLRWDPFRDLSRWRTPGAIEFAPAFDASETEKSYVFTADLPGVREEDLNISVSGDHLTVSGKREAEEEKREENYYLYERSYGSFSRSFALPQAIDADKIEADLKDGVLRIEVPKSPGAAPKKISVKSSPPPAAKAEAEKKGG